MFPSKKEDCVECRVLVLLCLCLSVHKGNGVRARVRACARACGKSAVQKCFALKKENYNNKRYNLDQNFEVIYIYDDQNLYQNPE